jgi:hypothetical protein
MFENKCELNDLVDIPTSYTEEMLDFFDYDPDAEISRALELIDHEINDLESDPSKPKIGQGPDVYIGFDSEFLSGKKGGDNTVLSLQFYLIGECGVLPKVIYPTGDLRSDRPSFYKTISSLIVEALEKQIILEWPRHIIVCGFFLRLDLPAFSDLVSFKTDLDSAGGRIASIGSHVKVKPDPSDIERLLHSKTRVTSANDGFNRLLQVRFVDVGSHVAVGTSISDMGKLINLPKLEIPAGFSIERMDLLLQHNKSAFESYGLRDAEIAVRYHQKLQDFAETHTGSRNLPVTASGLAVKIFTKQLQNEGVDFNIAFGVKINTITRWDNKKGKVKTFKNKTATAMRSFIEPFMASCYSGGRNECYAFGPSTIGVWNDFDLAGAYTTGLVDLRHIDYDNFGFTRDVNEFVGHVLGFAYVEFSFPDNTKFPSLPVRGSNDGLFYPLTGFSYCTAPEIEVALNLGCQIQIKHGVIIPWLEGDSRLFEPYVTHIRDLRKSYDTGSIDELYAKLLGNSLYGKTAQGLKKKIVFDTGKMKSVELDTSQITNAAIAAHTTGFIRAVLSEQIAGIPPHRKVISATTDGFITDAEYSELNLSGPMAIRFQALCQRVSPDSKMLELKHRVKQVVAIKTRGQITGVAHEGFELILAKCGVSPPSGTKDANDYMLQLFLNRQAGDMTETKPFTSIREQWNKDLDVVRDTRKMLLNLEYDFKRQLNDPLTIGVAGFDHVSLNSKPWSTVKDAERARAIFEDWRRKRCVKTLDDWYDYDDHYQFLLVKDRLKISRKNAGIRNSAKGTTDVFRRLFLRAYSQELCGLTKSKTYGEVADWLTNMGYPTTTDELKNAKRALFINHVIPCTERMKQFASLLCAGFPSININQFFEINLED